MTRNPLTIWMRSTKPPGLDNGIQPKHDLAERKEVAAQNLKSMGQRSRFLFQYIGGTDLE